MAKGIARIYLLFVLICSFVPHIAMAHPGRTDANGGHVCRTNCQQWGLQYGQYHYHNGGNQAPAYDPQVEYDAGYQKGYDIAYQYASNCQEYTWEWRGAQDYGDGFEDGIRDGDEDGQQVCEDNQKQEQEAEAKTTITMPKVNDITAQIEKNHNEQILKVRSYKFGKANGKQDYKNNKEFETDRNYSEDWDGATYKSAYKDGWNEAEKEHKRMQEESNKRMMIIAGGVGGVGLLTGAVIYARRKSKQKQ
ncbi:YHYH domain-containing protein [Ectobacillus antri]|uniref:YHYH domain-containing protein n=1 Tax=Ectobacillus antri TaxID=2486280 RepID=A0ABT6H5J4_9BACI|nr:MULTISPECIES: YHYH domain-containing protein [Ectobacillus]MDG4658093.1 YHYH domain-containing protein [Ectobacillus antri]MDG5753666.1 YHYH domain-containing protein [Ectobacillus antri]UOY93300.1 YHYH domain-containing protein [Ectobacillus sp. JY-23]